MLKNISLTFITVAIFILVAGGLGFGWFIQNSAAPSPTPQTKSFVIAKGTSATQIANDLFDQGLIKNVLAFKIYIKVLGISGRIQDGEYDLSTNYSLPGLIKKIMEGPTEVWVTIPEGLRREEVATKFILAFKLNSTNANSFYQQFLKLTEGKEGYLFPDTYLLAKSASPVLVDKIMEDNFNKKFPDAEKGQTNKLTKHDAVVLASIVQREAITSEDMQGVASVLENRLSIGMPLGSDVTLEYALGYQKDTKSWWKEGLTVADLALKTPYNTRLFAGLPPTPISNPGLVSLKAVFNPPQTDFLYYLSDKDGKLHFARTLSEHNANIQKYLK